MKTLPFRWFLLAPVALLLSFSSCGDDASTMSAESSPVWATTDTGFDSSPNQPAEGYTLRFPTESGSVERTLCRDGSLIETEVAEYDGYAVGFPTPEEAAEDGARGRREAASRPEIHPDLRPFLEPTRNLAYQPGIDQGPTGVAYFDIVAEDGESLLARLTIVATERGGWRVETSVHCPSVFVTDIEAYDTKVREIHGLPPVDSG
jgi:hypothetical protein